MLDNRKLSVFMEHLWEDDILPTLADYIRIPNKSPAFDKDWVAHRHMEKAVGLVETWARKHLPKLKGATLEVVRLEDRTPLILIEVPGTDAKSNADTVLLYGHLDKQPEMVGWNEGLGPWTPVRKGDKLYGRGGADDGYALFAALSALLALTEQSIPHARAVIVIEACEESGSPDLPAYIEHLAPRIGTPSLVLCLDSGCGNYDQLWLTTSLRGLCDGTLSARVLTEGVHSGDASGVVPSVLRILRLLLARIEDANTGEVVVPELHAPVPPARRAQAEAAAKTLGAEVFAKFPFAGMTRPTTEDLTELVLNRTWRPQLAVIGMAGFPEPKDAGNVALPFADARLSMRLPPTVDGKAALVALKAVLEADPPYGATVVFRPGGGQTGWDAPALDPWLEAAVAHASQAAFGAPPALMGEGGSIPFMAMLAARYPRTQFVITGVLGPGSNAHGPNEFLHIPAAKRVSAAITAILADHARR